MKADLYVDFPLKLFFHLISSQEIKPYLIIFYNNMHFYDMSFFKDKLFA